MKRKKKYPGVEEAEAERRNAELRAKITMRIDEEPDFMDSVNCVTEL